MELNALERLWFGEDDSTARELAAKSLVDTMSKIERLRPFPAVAAELLGMVNRQDVRAADISRVIDQDPALTVRTLASVNSAIYGLPRKCASVDQAVMLLGFRKIAEIAAGMAIMGTYDDKSAEGRRIQQHSVAVAGITHKVASQRLDLADEPAYTCGLLHDIGKLVMLQLDVPGYRDVIKNHEGPDAVWAAERELLGYDHAVLGGTLLEKWDVPEPVPTAVGLHHHPGQSFGASDKSALLSAAIRLADRLAYEIPHIEVSDEEAISSYLEIEPVQVLGLDRKDLANIWDAAAGAVALSHGRSDAK